MAQEAASSEPPRKKGKADRMARGMGEGGEKGPKRKKKGKKSGSGSGVGPPGGDGSVGAGASAPDRPAKPKKSAPPPAPKPPSPAWFKMVVTDFITFLKDVRREMKRVTWPSNKEVRVATIVVLCTLLVVTGFIAVVNYVLNLIFKLNPTG
jgi:preprotein translocase subunit SecE